jgi:hypothetical protein
MQHVARTKIARLFKSNGSTDVLKEQKFYIFAVNTTLCDCAHASSKNGIASLIKARKIKKPESHKKVSTMKLSMRNSSN